LITLGKRNDLHARRQAVRVIRNRSVVAKLFGTLADRYADRAGGYTRIIHIGQRQGDAAEMSILELIDRERTIDVQTAEPKEEEQPKKTRRSSKEAEPASEAVTEEAATSEAVTEEAATSEAEPEVAAAKTKKSKKADDKEE